MWGSRQADFELQVGGVDLNGLSFRRLAWRCCKALGSTEETRWLDLMGNTNGMQAQVAPIYASFCHHIWDSTQTRLSMSPHMGYRLVYGAIAIW